MAIKKVGVVGCGLMGSGITQVMAQAGYETLVREVNRELLDKGLGKLKAILDRSVSKGRITQEQLEATMGRIQGTTELTALKDCDIIIEAVTEDMSLKHQVYAALDKACPKTTIFASNTSSLSVTEMAAGTSRPDKFVGMHFFNPVPIMKLVEVVKTIATSSESFQTAYDFVVSLGKEPVETKDNSGFIVNYLLVPYLLDAIRALELGVGSVEDIDKGMKLGCGYPMGPLTLLDFVGLDTTYRIANIMFEEYRQAHYAPPPLLKRLFLMGYHGRKSGKGFYDYSTDPPKVVDLGL